MFAKAKQFLGIGGVTLELIVPNEIAKDADSLGGTLRLTSKSKQHITQVRVKFMQEYTTGRGDDEKTKTYELASMSFDEAFDMDNGDTREIPFTLSFTPVKSSNQELGENGGMLGALGKAAAFANNEKSSFYVEAEADVQGTFLDPSDKQELRIV